MGIFGRKGCDEEDRNWAVDIHTLEERGDNGYAVIAEQLNQEDAEKIYKKVQKQIRDNLSYIEIEFSNGVISTFIKQNIVKVELYQD